MQFGEGSVKWNVHELSDDCMIRGQVRGGLVNVSNPIPRRRTSTMQRD